jgi:Ca2+/Na+ antiporter
VQAPRLLELVTTLPARLHGHDAVGLSALLGSSLLNGLATVAVGAVLHPIRVPFAEVAAALGFGARSLLLMLPRARRISRARSVLLLGVYTAFAMVTLPCLNTTFPPPGPRRRKPVSNASG